MELLCNISQRPIVVNYFRIRAPSLMSESVRSMLLLPNISKLVIGDQGLMSLSLPDHKYKRPSEI